MSWVSPMSSATSYSRMGCAHKRVASTMQTLAAIMDVQRATSVSNTLLAEHGPETSSACLDARPTATAELTTSVSISRLRSKIGMALAYHRQQSDVPSAVRTSPGFFTDFWSIYRATLIVSLLAGIIFFVLYLFDNGAAQRGILASTGVLVWTIIGSFFWPLVLLTVFGGWLRQKIVA